jgi:branched-subunit amino acid transport protein
MTEVLMIVGMALVTVAVRYPVLALVGRIELPNPVLRALRFVPPSILAAIILPELLYRDDQIYIAVDNNFLVAGIIAGLVAWRSKNLLLTIVLGMLALWGWRALLSLV